MPCDNAVCGIKHSVLCSDPAHASDLHTEGPSVLGFFLCAEEFRECIFGLHREHKCAVHLKQGLLCVFPLCEVGYSLLVYL